MLLPLAYPDALAPGSNRLLASLAAPLADAELYLAGSAALTLYLGHRPVRDLDLMSMTNRLTPPERRDLLQAALAAAPGAQVETARDGYLACEPSARTQPVDQRSASSTTRIRWPIRRRSIAVSKSPPRSISD